MSRSSSASENISRPVPDKSALSPKNQGDAKDAPRENFHKPCAVPRELLEDRIDIGSAIYSRLRQQYGEGLVPDESPRCRKLSEIPPAEWEKIISRAFENLPADSLVTRNDVDAILTWCWPCGT